MKSYKILFAAFALLLAVSCNSARVSGVIREAEGKNLNVKVLGIGKYDVIDTVLIGKGGKFSYSLDVQKGQPRFVYLAYNGRNIVSLLLESGDRVKVTTDTLGRERTVVGSEESLKLMETEKSYSDFLNSLLTCTDRTEYVKKYVSHYRECVEYVIKNSNSMTAIPVLHEKITEYSPIFAQTTDAIHFRTVCDSLKKIYPQSAYVKALEEETRMKEGSLQLQETIRNVQPSGFPDLSLPDIKAKVTRLSDVDSKVILLHFWDSSDPVQKMMNKEILQPVYDEYHKRGFEIYAVDLNPDKVTWATVVKSQNLQWINVNDGKGLASAVISTYNVQGLPNSILICDGDIVNAGIKGVDGLRKELQKRL